MGNILNSATQEMAQVIQSKINNANASKLHQHCLSSYSRDSQSNDEQWLAFTIMTNDATPMTFADVRAYLSTHGFALSDDAEESNDMSTSKLYSVIGWMINNNMTYRREEVVTGMSVKSDEPNKIILFGSYLKRSNDPIASVSDLLIRIDSSLPLKDTVISEF